MPSASSNFPRTMLYNSSLNTHLPNSAHLPQAIHPCTAFAPMDTISVSTPFASKAFATSDRAMYVFPLPRGLPLINNTFMTFVFYSANIQNPAAFSSSKRKISCRQPPSPLSFPLRAGMLLAGTRLWMPVTAVLSLIYVLFMIFHFYVIPIRSFFDSNRTRIEG